MLTKEAVSSILRAFATQIDTIDYVRDGAAMIDRRGKIYNRAEAMALLDAHLEFLDSVGDDVLNKLNSVLVLPLDGINVGITNAPEIEALTWGFVYLMHNRTNGLYKIGRSGTPDKRVRGVRATEGTEHIDLVHSIKSDDCIWLEAKFHILFEHCRRHGEWFELQRVDVEWFRGHDEWNRFPTPPREPIDHFAPRDTRDLYTRAVEFAQENERVSISTLQRHLRVGYVAGAKMIERLEADGVIAPKIGEQQWRNVIHAATTTQEAK